MGSLLWVEKETSAARKLAHAGVEPLKRGLTGALADPTRRAILARLASGEASVAELAKPFAMSQPAISKHLEVLERAGLVSHTARAQQRPHRIEAEPLAEATAWLERYRELWESNFLRLDALLEELEGSSASTAKKSTSTKRKRR